MPNPRRYEAGARNRLLDGLAAFRIGVGLFSNRWNRGCASILTK